MPSGGNGAGQAPKREPPPVRDLGLDRAREPAPAVRRRPPERREQARDEPAARRVRGAHREERRDRGDVRARGPARREQRDHARHGGAAGDHGDARRRGARAPGGLRQSGEPGQILGEIDVVRARRDAGAHERAGVVEIGPDRVHHERGALERGPERALVANVHAAHGQVGMRAPGAVGARHVQARSGALEQAADAPAHLARRADHEDRGHVCARRVTRRSCCAARAPPRRGAC